MTGLSRCGKKYPEFADAVKAAQARTFKSGRAHTVWGCPAVCPDATLPERDWYPTCEGGWNDEP